MLVPIIDLPRLHVAGGENGGDGSATEAEQQQERFEPCAEALRVGVIGEVVTRVEGGMAGLTVEPYVELLQKWRCRVGPWTLPADGGDTEGCTDEEMVSWLDAGAYRAIFHVERASEVAVLEKAVEWAKARLPEGARHRFVAALSLSDFLNEQQQLPSKSALRGAVDALRAVVSCVQIDVSGCGGCEEEVTSMLTSGEGEDPGALKRMHGKEGASDYVELTVINNNSGEGTGKDQRWAWSGPHVGLMHREYGVDVVSQCRIDNVTPAAAPPAAAPGATPPPPPAPESLSVDLGEAYVACLRSDRPDGLYTTVVTDGCGRALGLVYSNDQSIKASLSCGRGVYWSRSRGGLWRKGDSSGAWQELTEMSLDCDSDALRVSVVQHGEPPAFCHFNRRNCWEEEGGLGHLERLLQRRKLAAPEGSYTKRLFEDKTLLRNKLVEEAQELAEAQTPEEVASEAADVAYFMMVRCTAAGVGLKDVERWLDKRALKLKRRPGNAKAYRIAEGDKILDSKKG